MPWWNLSRTNLFVSKCKLHAKCDHTWLANGDTYCLCHFRGQDNISISEYKQKTMLQTQVINTVTIFKKIAL